jgi:hypothetical protein
LVLQTKLNKRKEAPVDINTTLETLRASDELPFKDVLSTDAINKRIENIDYRERFFTPDMTIFGFLSQVISEDKSCQAAVGQVIAHLASHGQATPSANTAAYSNARARLPEETLSGLARESAEQLEDEAPSQWLWRGKHVKLIDGAVVSMPDTPENQAVYPQPSTQKNGLASLWRG